MPISSRTKFITTLSLAFYVVILLRTAWISEDAFITFRTIRNLLAGFGPVWNVGERVQSYTHPLWMFLLALPIAITGEYFYTVIVLSLVVSLLAVWLLTRQLASGAAAAVVALLILTLSKSFTDYSTSGLENPLTHLLLVLFFAQFLSSTLPTRRQLFWLSLLAALLILNRMDSGLIVLPALVVAWWRVRSWWALASMALAFLPILAWELFSLIYYGFPFPNTAYAKLNTGLSNGESMIQGTFYLLSLLTTDPLAAAVIGVGLWLAIVDRTWRVRMVAVGMVLYLLYIVRIGGDYMAGRFFTAPLLLATLVIARQPRLFFSPALTLGSCALVTLLGVMNPDQAALLSGINYAYQRIEKTGISDERGLMYPVTGLLSSTRFNREYDSGLVQGRVYPANYISDMAGKLGFISSPYSYGTDRIGLSDPLLARLPMRHEPYWRIGHPVRTLPEGYMLSLRTGQNQLSDPNLRLYYDKLRLITRGPLFDRERLREIWRFNLGEYEPLIDRTYYRFPERIPVDLTQITRTFTETMGMPTALPFKQDGVLVDLKAIRHAYFLLIGANLDQFDLYYYRAGQMIEQQSIRASPIASAGPSYQAIQVPANVRTAGYDAIHFFPTVHESYDSRYAEIQINSTEFVLTFFDMVAEDGELSSTAAEQLIELYLYFFYRAQPYERDGLLQQIVRSLDQVDSDRWRKTSVLKLAQLYQLPEPTISTFALDRFPANVVLSDKNGKPQIRYLGANQSTVITNGVKLDLNFEVLSDVTTDYSAWFHIKSVDGSGEWMIYDYFPPVQMSHWREALVIQFPVTVKLEHGEFEVAFGFWTPQRERLYVDKDKDIYWVSLGKYQR